MSELAGAQLVTLAGPARARIGPEMRDLGMVPDGAMLIRDGRIALAGSRADVEARVSPAAFAQEHHVGRIPPVSP